MSSNARATPSFWLWAQLVRLPAVFTVVADVSAAFLLVSRGRGDVLSWALVVAGAVALYWAGLILNDVFDLAEDRRERSGRPLASGKLAVGPARAVGWGLLALGVIVAAASGYVPGHAEGASWLPALVAVILALMIVAYDGPLKNTPLAPALMGGCRVLSFLLGAAAALPPPIIDVELGLSGVFPRHVIAIAAGFGIYVMGITTISRREAIGGRSPDLVTGLFVTVVGALVLAFGPQYAEPRPNWFVSVERTFPILIFLILAPILMRLLRLLRDPSTERIQYAVRIGILTIIPLAAAFALLGAGPVWGITIFLLVVPSQLLARRLRVT